MAKKKLEYKVMANGRLNYDRVVDGHRCHIMADTEKELQTKLKALIQKHKKQDEEARQRLIEEEANRNNPLFETVAEAWYASAEKELQPGTYKSYKSALDFACNEYAGVRIRDIETYHISQSLSRLADRDYSKKTINNYKIVFSRIFNYWINDPVWHGDRNPVTFATIPRKAKGSVERTPPTQEQLNAIAAHPEGAGLWAMLLWYTGMRIEEANALQKKDIFFEKESYGIKGSIHVYKAMPWLNNKPYLKNTKTSAGERWIPIFSPIYTTLKKYCASLAADDYILSGTNEPLTESRYQHQWNSYFHKIGFAHSHPEKIIKYRGTPKEMVYYRTVWNADVTAHQFRHLLATVFYENKIPELVICKIMGHADIITTQNIYTHIRDPLMQENISRIDQYLSGSASNVLSK